MTNTEAIYFLADGASSSAENYWSTGNQTPTISADQTLTDSITSQTTTITLKTVRKLDPQKTNQYVLSLDKDIKMGYACQMTAKTLGTKHTSAGGWTLFIPSDGTVAGAGSLIYSAAVAISAATLILF